MKHIDIAIPTGEQLEWSSYELGAIIHFDIGVFEPEYIFRERWDYVPDPAISDPKSLDTDQWVRTAVAAGIKYIVLVAKLGSFFRFILSVCWKEFQFVNRIGD